MFAEALDAHRRRDKIEDGIDAGEPTIEATVGKLLEAQIGRATIRIATALDGLKNG